VSKCVDNAVKFNCLFHLEVVTNYEVFIIKSAISYHVNNMHIRRVKFTCICCYMLIIFSMYTELPGSFKNSCGQIEAKATVNMDQ
jgi:hypothetical protein